MKKCNKCGMMREYKDFSKCKSHKDGLKSICKKCQLAYNRVYIENNKDRTSEYHKR